MIPALGRSPGEGKGCPLQDSGLENSMYILRGHKSPTRLRDSHFHFQGKMRLFRVVVKQGLLCNLQITKTPGFGGFFFKTHFFFLNTQFSLFIRTFCLCRIQDLSSRARDQTHTPSIGSLNHGPPEKSPSFLLTRIVLNSGLS